MDGLKNAKPIGWRARIGVIVPPSNTGNEAEFNRLKPDGVTYPFTRSPIHGDPAADGFVGLMNDVEIACDDMVRCNVDVIAYGCTSGSMAAPAEVLIGKMKEVGKVDALSTAGSILKALGKVDGRLEDPRPMGDGLHDRNAAVRDLQHQIVRIGRVAGRTGVLDHVDVRRERSP